ncbi:hypothetical protein BKA62DRAFT_691548 [Auriculariales sp. MPI-PUGE-AT-0066]|nr:hypothetical protein BKA62DRAFT_691548 [Auriculariales sp. MPI-PUGE-AT-0066]
MRLLVALLGFVVFVSSSHAYVVDIHHEDARVIFSPERAWAVQQSGTNGTSSIRETRTKHADATLTFQGSSVSISCDTAARSHSFRVEIDGAVAKTETETAGGDIDDAVLFFVNNLELTRQHTITITNLADGQYLCIGSFSIMDPPDFEVTATVLSMDAQYLRQYNFAARALHWLQRRKEEQPIPRAGLVFGGAFGGAAVIFAMIAVALVAMPPDPLPHMQPLVAADQQRRREERLRQHPNIEALRTEGSAGRRSPQGQAGSSQSRRPPIQVQNNPFSSGIDLDEGNPFASNRQNPAPFVTQAGSSSRLDLDASSASGSGASSSIARVPSPVPGTTSTRLRPGEGFICMKCSVELSRERTRRMEQQQQHGNTYEFYNSHQHSHSHSRAGPSSSPNNPLGQAEAGPGPSSSAGFSYPPM